MTAWNQNDLRLHMKVYSSDGEQLGHIAEIYEDSFLVHKGYFFPNDRYIPYREISALTANGVHLTLSISQMEDRQWEKRPDDEEHVGDPTQLMYDRGHGIHDPFDDTGPDQPNP